MFDGGVVFGKIMIKKGNYEGKSGFLDFSDEGGGIE